MPAKKNQLLLQQAFSHRQLLSFPFVAITGSNGKTTTKRMLFTILRKAGRVYDFDYNSFVADRIAEELLHVQNKYDWALVKLGAIDPDSVMTAANLIAPEMGIVTNVGEAHLARHGTIEKIAAEKQQLLSALGKDGVAILNRDNEFTRSMGDSFDGQVIYFGLSELSDYYATNIEQLGPEGTAFTLCRKFGNSLRLHLPIFSLGDIYNALAAIAAANHLGIQDEIIIDSLENDFCLPDGRGVLHVCSQNINILDDTYDATPQSLMKSTKSLLSFRNYSDRLILTMGDMTELGQQSKTIHSMMGHYLAGMPIDVILLIGKNVHQTAKALKSSPSCNKKVREFASMTEAEKWFYEQIHENDTVLIEGSEKQDMSVLVKNLVMHCRETDFFAPKFLQ